MIGMLFISIIIIVIIINIIIISCVGSRLLGIVMADCLWTSCRTESFNRRQ